MALKLSLMALLITVIGCGKFSSQNSYIGTEGEKVLSVDLGVQENINAIQIQQNQVPLESGQRLSVMSYNIHGIPCQKGNLVSSITSFVGFVEECPHRTWFTEKLPERLQFLLNKLDELDRNNALPDVLMLQEAFTSEFSQVEDSAMESFLAQLPYQYQVKGPASLVNNNIFNIAYSLFSQNGVVDSGLVILSRYPIIEKNIIEYKKDCAAGNCFANKGALHVRVQLPNTKTIDIYNTHHQSFLPYDQIRLRNNISFLDLVRNTAISPWIIMGGDFNFRNTSNYQSFNDFLNKSNSQHAGKVCLRSANCQYLKNYESVIAGDTLDHQFIINRSQDLSIQPIAILTDDWSFFGRKLSDHDFLYIQYILK